MKEQKHLSEALSFFIYDSVKIVQLLFIVIFSMGIINSYSPIERAKNFLTRKKLYGTEYLMALASVCVMMLNKEVGSSKLSISASSI